LSFNSTLRPLVLAGPLRILKVNGGPTTLAKRSFFHSKVEKSGNVVFRIVSGTRRAASFGHHLIIQVYRLGCTGKIAVISGICRMHLQCNIIVTINDACGWVILLIEHNYTPLLTSENSSASLYK
jgi:hypothetical protein